MEEPWKILLYRTVQKESPVKEFIDRLEIKSQSKVRNTIKLLENFGTKLGLPHTKKLTGTKLWELRILGADSIRVLYIAITDKTFPKEIKIAEERLSEQRSRS